MEARDRRGRPAAQCLLQGLGHRGLDQGPIAGGPTIWPRSSTMSSSEFGPDRVVFGGDWPVCTLGAPLAAWVKALREVVRGPEARADQRKLFHDNAVRVYRLR